MFDVRKAADVLRVATCIGLKRNRPTNSSLLGVPIHIICSISSLLDYRFYFSLWLVDFSLGSVLVGWCDGWRDLEFADFSSIWDGKNRMKPTRRFLNRISGVRAIFLPFDNQRLTVIWTVETPGIFETLLQHTHTHTHTITFRCYQEENEKMAEVARSIARTLPRTESAEYGFDSDNGM